MKKAIIPILVACVLWFAMFSPWTASHLNFWVTMAISGVILTTMSLAISGELREKLKSSFRWSDVPIGIIIGIVLWGIFWVGDKVATWMFPFADGQIGSIYSMRDGSDYWMIGALLTFVVGPAEEIFWRGFVQEECSKRWTPAIGFLVTTAIYAFAHIWAMNFMLIAAAAVAGGVWGLLYRLYPQRLWALIISHAVWDVAVFLVFPI